MLIIKGIESADYFNIVCDKCDQPTKNEYLGWDPVVPYFKATCEKCGTTGQWKLSTHFWSGLPSKPVQNPSKISPKDPRERKIILED